MLYNIISLTFTEYWKRVVEENRDWFIDDEKYKPILK